jgi:polysaccharide export outer membrane protein
MAKDPANIARLRAEMARTGMTPAQVQAKLVEMGYSRTMLDAFLPGSTDTSAALTPDVFAAFRALNVMDSVSLDALTNPALRAKAADSASNARLLDSIRVALKDTSTAEAFRRLMRNPALRDAQADSGLTIFGLDAFSRNTSQFNANLTGPVDDNYVLGAGDQLVVTLTGEVNKSYSVEVNRDGIILFEDLGGPLHVANLSKLQAERLVLGRLSQAHSTLSTDNRGRTRMLFSVARQGIKTVRVTGDVNVPNQYNVPSSATIISALYQAGGPTESGSLRNVQLRRGSQLITTFDVYQYLTAGNSANDFRVESGDVIFVPPRSGRVRIAGEVLRPATYELKAGETLRDLVRLAGNLTPTADRRRIQIERVVPPAQRTQPGRDRQVFDVMDPALAQTGVVPATTLEPDDIVRVMPIANRVSGQVTVSGNVWSGGSVAFSPGMRLSTALSRAGGIKPDTYLGQISISRLRSDSTRVTLRAGLRDTLGTPTDDLELQDSDVIEVFSLTAFRATRYVEIGGMVRKPGRYPYREGMTLRDLMLLANGPAEGALLTEAELSRLPADRQNGTLATITKVPLDSLYLFERSPDGRYVGPPGVPSINRAPEVTLQPYDHILVLRQPDWSLQRLVAIAGEVKSPGRYALHNKDERLASLLARAGGLGREADSNAVVFIRRGVGRVGISLDSVRRNPASVDNLVLVEGDSIFFPAFSGVVSIRGAVNAPVAMAYVPGADINYYIRAAGGPTPFANTRRAFVTQPNGRVETVDRHFFGSTVPVPRPGSSIEVPIKDPSQKTDWASITSTTISVLGSLVAIAAIVRR